MNKPRTFRCAIRNKVTDEILHYGYGETLTKAFNDALHSVKIYQLDPPELYASYSQHDDKLDRYLPCDGPNQTK